MFATGAVIGLVSGGHLIQTFGWQSTFYSIIPVSIALLVIIARFIHVEEPHLMQKRPVRVELVLEIK